MRLYNRLPTKVEYEGRIYPIKPQWPAVLAALDVLEDDTLSSNIQISCALDLLVDAEHPQYSAALLKAIFEILSPPKSGPQEPPVIDFRQDWDLIYAGFWQAYQIDLFERKDMHWMQFSALLKGMPSGTRLSDIIEIRQMPIPKPDRYNGEYRAHIMKLKTKYALKNRSTSVNDGLWGLFNALKAQAERR